MLLFEYSYLVALIEISNLLFLAKNFLLTTDRPQLRESVLQFVESATMGFIWHHEAFTLSVAVPSEGDVEPHLTGHQVFGGNVSDEWMVCYLLFTVTSMFTE